MPAKTTIGAEMNQPSADIRRTARYYLITKVIKNDVYEYTLQVVGGGGVCINVDCKRYKELVSAGRIVK